MSEWLLSGHNTQESIDITRPITVTMAERGLNNQISWFLSQLAGDTSDFAPLNPSEVVQGRLYLNIHYYTRNMASVMPFDPESVGVPAGLVDVTARVPPGRLVRLPWRFYRTYRWAAHFCRQVLPALDQKLKRLYWRLREAQDDPLPLVWALFEPDLYTQVWETNRAHIIVALTITALDSILRQRAPALLNLFAGQATATSLIGQQAWELRRTAERCGLRVCQMLADGVTDLNAYKALPQAAPFVAGVQAFLRQHGHRGFCYEADLEAERVADHPEQLLLAVAGQLDEHEPPEQRAATARQTALQALARMNPAARLFWRRILKWGQQLIAWREEAKSNVVLRQAAYGLAARYLARHFYPHQPQDTLMFYTLDEFLAFVRSRGKERVDQARLDQRRAQFDLYRQQPPPPELIWYDPQTRRWRPAVEEARPARADANRWQGIPASAGSGPAQGTAIVVNDPVEAARRLLQMEGPVVLVTRLTDPAWSSLFHRLSAVVTELGGVISHAAIVARENGLPAVVGVTDITRLVRDGQRLRVDGASGIVEVLD